MLTTDPVYWVSAVTEHMLWGANISLLVLGARRANLREETLLRSGPLVGYKTCV